MTFLHFLILTFAIFRLSSLLVYEAGPFRLFEKIRDLTGLTDESEPEGFFQEVFSCFDCMSVWVAIFVAPAYLLFPEATVALTLFAALSGSSILVNKTLT